MTPSLKIGTRSSRLAQRQAESALHLLQNSFPAFSWELALFSSPGDRDQTADLVSAPGDFFTRDLDNALLAGTIDCAVHSAKDLPDPLPEGIDWV
jgi:hydroxymethylbilane synthase